MAPWKRGLRGLSPRAEIALVLTTALGWFVYTSTRQALDPGAPSAMTSGDVLGLVVTELVLGTMALGVLHVRGWRPADLGRPPSLSQAALGVVLFGASNLVLLLAYGLVVELVGGSEAARVSATAGLPLLVLLVVVNPVFEEVFLVGYTLTAVGRLHGPWVALAVSVVVRASYHTYQGPAATLMVALLGVILGLCYLRWRALTPLVVAHALFDAVGLFQLS